MTLLNQLMETCAYLTKQVANLEQDKVAQAVEITKLKQRVRRLEKKRQYKSLGIKRMRKGRLVESQAKVYHLDLEHAKKVLSMQDTDEAELTKVGEVIKVVTVAKLMTEVVTIAQVPKASAPRRRNDVVIHDLEETATASVIMHSKVKGMTYTDIRHIFKKHYNSIQAFLDKGEEEITEQEEGSKRKDTSPEQREAKKQRIDEEEEELKRHLHIVADNDDDVFTEATPLTTKVHVVDYQIYYENNKPFYKIIRVDGTHKLFLSFITVLNNFDREDLEMLWKSPMLKLAYRERKMADRLEKVKRWKLFESCGVYIIIFITTQMLPLVKRKYPFDTLDYGINANNVRLEVEKESEMSLELLRLVRRQLQEGYIPE
nr:hypothetical protein [Tanacetum cinerariifolium]